jgi:cytidylate kinase
MNKGFAIAIDGPVASGKGTLAPNLAKKLDGFFLDTGAMYRCVALYAQNNHIDPGEKEAIEKIAKEIDIDYLDGKTILNGRDVSSEIRTESISRAVPIVARFEGVRQELVAKQRKVARRALDSGSIVILEGRDIATIVLPDAQVKIYLTAKVEERAKRRRDQLADQGEMIDLVTVLEDIKERDRKDIEINKTLVSNPQDFGYEILDNSDLTQEQTLEAVVEILKERKLYDPL